MGPHPLVAILMIKGLALIFSEGIEQDILEKVGQVAATFSKSSHG